MSSLKLLVLILCLLVLLVAVIPTYASEGLWRAPGSIPGYQPKNTLDPRPPRGFEWNWLSRAENIWTEADMVFHMELKGKKPVFNYYFVSECPDEDTNEV